MYNPGCALMLYKKHLAINLLNYLNKGEEKITLHDICCHHNPQIEDKTCIINTCAGCDRRFSTLYENVETHSIWEEIVKRNDFDYPDHSGLVVSVHDTCSIRHKPQVHNAIRQLLEKMNIKVIEAEYSKDKSICCGDNLYPHVPVDKVYKHMRKRAQSMPCEHVVVYCVSCIKAMHNGGKKPLYIVDLLFNEATEIQESDVVKWHEQLNEYIEQH